MQASPSPTRKVKVKWQVFSACFPRGDPRPAEFTRSFDSPSRMANSRGEGGVIYGVVLADFVLVYTVLRRDVACRMEIGTFCQRNKEKKGISYLRFESGVEMLIC